MSTNHQSFVVFAADFISKNHGEALDALDDLDRRVNAAAAEGRSTWNYEGIRRSLERRLAADSTERRSALLTVLTFVQENGKMGTLDEARRLLESQSAKE